MSTSGISPLGRFPFSPKFDPASAREVAADFAPMLERDVRFAEGRQFFGQVASGEPQLARDQPRWFHIGITITGKRDSAAAPLPVPDDRPFVDAILMRWIGASLRPRQTEPSVDDPPWIRVNLGDQSRLGQQLLDVPQ